MALASVKPGLGSTTLNAAKHLVLQMRLGWVLEAQ